MSNPLDGPALAPPPGVKPNFDAPGLTRVYIAILVLALTSSSILVLVRSWTRFRVIRKHGSEDYAVILSWALTVVFCSLSAVCHHYGLGKHQWDISLRDLILVVKWVNLCTILYDLAFMFVKLSIVTQYRKIFVPKSKSNAMWWCTWALTIIFICFYTILAFLNIFQCIPREKIWNPRLQGRCFNVNAIRLSSASINLVTDLIILLLPQPAIWKLNLPFQTRFGLAIVFAIGVFACIFSAIRLYFTYRLAHTKDISFVAMQFGLWTLAELCCGIICACLPVFPRFVQSTLRGTTIYDRIASTVQSLISRRSASRRTSEADAGEQRIKTGSSSGKTDNPGYETPKRADSQDAELEIIKTVAIETNASESVKTFATHTKPREW